MCDTSENALIGNLLRTCIKLAESPGLEPFVWSEEIMVLGCTEALKTLTTYKARYNLLSRMRPNFMFYPAES